MTQASEPSHREYALHAARYPGATAHTFVAELDDRITVDGPDGNHLARVRRLRVGEILTASTGDGWWRSYTIIGVERDELRLEAVTLATMEPQPTSTLTVAPSLISRARFDDAVVMMVELGVDRIIPLAAQRCVVEWRGAKASEACERLRRLAREAAMQCRRSYLPEILELASPCDLAHQPGLVIASASREAGLATTFAADPDLTVATGPEGGFSPDDLAQFGSFATVWLGPHVLRAETAAVSVVAAFRGSRLVGRHRE